jgi:hypothetical protein
LCPDEFAILKTFGKNYADSHLVNGLRFAKDMIETSLPVPALPDFSSLAPYGIGIVAVVGLVFLGLGRGQYLVAAAMAAIIVIAIFEEVLKTKATPAPDGNPPPPDNILGVYWVDTNILGDWGGRDRLVSVAPTNGSSLPVYQAQGGIKLCDDSQRGVIAVCWDGNCTYKKPEVRVGTPMNGLSPGRVYVCGRIVSP